MSTTLMDDLLDEIQLENQAWAQKHLKTLKVGQVVTTQHKGVQGGCQLALQEIVGDPKGDVSYSFSVVLFGVVTGKEVFARRKAGRWSFSTLKV